jgi:hypothetical protein
MGGVNNGTNWSYFLTTNAGDNFDASGPKYYAFDGNGSNKAFTGNNSDGTTQGTSFLQVNFPSPISGALRVKCDSGNTVRNVTSGDTLLATQSSGSDNQFVDCGNVSNLSKLRVLMSGGSRPAISVVELGGTTLVDPVSPVGNAAATTFNPFTTDINAVRGQETGYATLDPINKISNAVLSNGNLYWSCDNTGAGTVLANVSVNSGKWYWEVTSDTTDRFHAGVHNSDVNPITIDAGIGNTNWAFRTDGYKVHNGTDTQITSDISNVGEVIQLAYDADNGGLYFGANGHWLEGNPSVLSSPSYTGVTNTAGISPMLNRRTNSNAAYINFGQKPFKFPPPAGFQPLNAANVRPETVIVRPDQFVGASIWTGNNTENRLIPLNMKPDLIWIKQRNDIRVHILQDSVRGFTKGLYSNDTDAESTRDPGYGEAVPGGFEVSSGAGSNVSGRTMVAWSWKAGGSKNTFNIDDVGYATASAAGLTAGTITPTGASVNTKSGFSIIKATMGPGTSSFSHGLGQKPAFIIVKNTASTSNWVITHKSLGTNMNDYYLLFTTAASTNSAGIWGGEPTSTTFSLGTGLQTANQAFVSYCWHDVPGLQKFGSYEGNGSADGGPFVELGFQPAIIWLKNADDGTNRHWCVVDATRTEFNKSASAEVLFLDDNQVESYANDNYGQFGSKPCVDILSNGFKVREGDTNAVYTQTNRPNTIIYCAWAEAPTFNLYGGQSNAR